MGYQSCKPQPVKIVLGLTAGVLIASIFALLFGKLVQLLWNGTVSDIFQLSDISYWQAVGLLLLSRILVGGMGHGHGGHERHMKFHDKMRNKMSSKWCKDGRDILEKQAEEVQ